MTMILILIYQDSCIKTNMSPITKLGPLDVLGNLPSFAQFTTGL